MTRTSSAVRSAAGNFVSRLLPAISLKKLGKQIERNRAAKRAMSAEGGMSDLTGDVDAIACSKELAPDEELLIKEEVELLMSGLDEAQRQMVEMRLAGYRLEEIATETQRSERTVRRLLEKIKVSLELRFVRADG